MPDNLISQGSFTQAVHASETRGKPQHALVDPIFQTSTYTFDNMADAYAYQETHAHGHAADGRAMSADEFRRRMGDDVRAPFKRTIPNRNKQLEWSYIKMVK